MIPGSYFTVGANNTIVVETGDSPETSTGCSEDDKAIYTLSFNTLADYGNVYRKSDGCNWSIMFSDNTIINKPVPDGVEHTKSCSYNNTNITYDLDDSLDDAVYRLLKKLDVDDDGRVDVSLNEDDISFEGTYTGSVRSLWGPLKVKLILWM